MNLATLRYLVELGIPLLGLCGVFWWARRKWREGELPSLGASRDGPANLHQVTDFDIRGWVNALKLHDPDFDLEGMYAKARHVFELLQRGWADGDMEGVRPFLSDATYQRFRIHLELLRKQGIRNAQPTGKLKEVKLMGLAQSKWFDTVHLRIEAQVRAPVPPADPSHKPAAGAPSEGEAEPLVEVWSFVRKPGTKTRASHDLFQGRCPNCGARYNGGATNACSFCKAIVNSGNYDWTLAEITQGKEHVAGYPAVDGLMQAREHDPALNLTMLEDRVALLFWRWIEVQASGDPRALIPVSSQAFLDTMGVELASMSARKLSKVFLDCAVAAVNTRFFRAEDGYEQAHVEIRWKARMGVGPRDGPTPDLIALPQRWMFVVMRKASATTRTETGLATSRCGRCAAPLTDAGATTCAYCGTSFTAGEYDWVLSSAQPYEAWSAAEANRFQDIEARQAAYRAADVILDPQERQRLLFMMAAIASADGVLDDNERKLLELCANRWLVPWPEVEAALKASPEVFDPMLPAATSPDAVVFMESLARMALIGGHIEDHERRILEAVALRLGMSEQLTEMLARLRRA